MKRVFYIVVVLAVISFGARYATAQLVGGDVRKLLSGYGIEPTELNCVGGFLSRGGHCFFRTADDGASLKGQLDRDLEEQRPKNQSRMDLSQLGSGLCKEAFNGIDPVLPRTQLGGGSLPYLGRVYFDTRENRGCLEFEYGYG